MASRGAASSEHLERLHDIFRGLHADLGGAAQRLRHGAAGGCCRGGRPGTGWGCGPQRPGLASRRHSREGAGGEPGVLGRGRGLRRAPVSSRKRGCRGIFFPFGKGFPSEILASLCKGARPVGVLVQCSSVRAPWSCAALRQGALGCGLTQIAYRQRFFSACRLFNKRLQTGV